MLPHPPPVRTSSTYACSLRPTRKGRCRGNPHRGIRAADAARNRASTSATRKLIAALVSPNVSRLLPSINSLPPAASRPGRRNLAAAANFTRLSSSESGCAHYTGTSQLGRRGPPWREVHLRGSASSGWHLRRVLPRGVDLPPVGRGRQPNGFDPARRDVSSGIRVGLCATRPRDSPRAPG